MTTPKELSDRYTLGETLGFGGMSEVHLARDLRLNRDVAVKVLRADLARDPSFYLRFRREAQNAASLNHPTIVQVYDTGESTTPEGPLPYIVMEYVDGETLRDVLRREGHVAPRRAMAWIADVCAALDFSHKNNIVHRDMKPGNVMIDRSGAVKVMDFGIARAISDSTMTQTAAVIGTAQYMSPEQAHGETVDARSDVYSVGCVLFELLTGQPPFTGDSPLAVAYQHVRQDPPLPSSLNSDIARELDSIVLKAMSKNPANRYQSAAEMRSDLMKVLAGGKPSAPVILGDDERQEMFQTTPAPAAKIGVRRSRHRADDIKGSSGSKPVALAEQPHVVDYDPSDRRTGRVAAIVVSVVMVVALLGGVTYYLATQSGPGAEGPRSLAIPNVIHKTAQDATVQLESLGLKVHTSRRSDENEPSGQVISTDPPVGTEVRSDSSVIINVSSGPKQIPVPNVRGMTVDEAQAAIEKVGLRVDPNVTQAESTAEEKGKVIDSTPVAGANATSKTPVKLVVGSGPAQSTLIDVTGQPVDQAQKNLEALGFKVTVMQVDGYQDKNTVISQSPPAGTKVDPGASITVRVSRGNQIQVPDLTGMSMDDAEAALRKTGWNGRFIRDTADKIPIPPGGDGLNNKVGWQSAAPGSGIAKNQVVTIKQFGH